MTLLTRSRGTLAAGLIAALLTGFPTQAAAQETVKTVVLVHGAWANGSSWSRVIPLLVAKGLRVVALEIPLTSLADDVATTRRALALEPRPVLLVGHSYGGAVITEAGNDPKVKGLLYIAAYAPDQGESAFSLAIANPTPVGPELMSDPGGAYYKLSEKGVMQDFAQDLSELERYILFVTQGPTGTAALGSPITAPAWRSKATWFIVANQDRIISPDLERFEARRMNATTISLNTSHVAMLAEPERVAEFIAQAAQHLGGK